MKPKSPIVQRNWAYANTMRIVNSQVKLDIEQGRKIKLNLGGGLSKKKGFYSLDVLDLNGIDIIADLNEPLDLLPDNCVDYVYSNHVFEHVQNLIPLLREIFRITTRDGTIETIVPHFSNPFYYSDPTHVRFFGLYSMYYFVDRNKQPARRKVPHFYSDVRFEIKSMRIDFFEQGIKGRIIAKFLSKIINRNIRWQHFFERRLSFLLHAQQIRYVMRPDK